MVKCRWKSPVHTPISHTMNIRIQPLASVFISLLICACAGRDPQLVGVVQPHDRSMNCSAIFAEIEANNRKIEQLASEKGLKVAQNVLTGVGGLFIPVLWFGMDWKGAQSKEMQALQSRQQYLATLAQERGCGGRR